MLVVVVDDSYPGSMVLVVVVVEVVEEVVVVVVVVVGSILCVRPFLGDVFMCGSHGRLAFVGKEQGLSRACEVDVVKNVLGDASPSALTKVATLNSIRQP